MFEEFPAEDVGGRAAPAAVPHPTAAPRPIAAPRPTAPARPALSTAPALPAFPALPNLPGAPTLPSLPGPPAHPGPPAPPALPALPGLPLPGFGQATSGFGAAPGGGQDALPLLAPLSALLPGGVRRGDAVAVQSRDRTCDYLTLALLAGALAAGLWCAAVGVPELGGAALAELLATPADPHGRGGLDRLLLTPDPGDRWAQVTVAMADGVDLVLVRPPGPVDAAVGRRVDARLRQGRSTDTRHSAALVVLGTWPSARVVLRTEQTAWVGLNGSGPLAGTGHLRGGLATVVAQGRATGGQTRSVQLWLPAADGTAQAIGADVDTVGGTATAAVPAAQTPPSPADKNRRLTAVA